MSDKASSLRLVHGDPHEDIMRTMIRDIQSHSEDAFYMAKFIAAQPVATYDFIVSCAASDFPNATKGDRPGELVAHLGQGILQTFHSPGVDEDVDLMETPYEVERVAKEGFSIKPPRKPAQVQGDARKDATVR